MTNLAILHQPSIRLTNIERDVEGYLFHPEDWDIEIAAELASEENIELTDDYWPIIEFVREYWEEHQITPDIRHVAAHIAQETTCSKKQAKNYLFSLFPYGYVKQACKIAGMQRPRAWSTG